jgi:hypothetical protein
MTKAPPLQRDSQARASESDIRRMTGSSRTGGTPYHRHVHHEKIGDHRQGIHTGRANSSAVSHTQPGHPAGNGAKLNGLD